MANHHRRESSIPTIRLSQPLPPLPLDNLRPRNLPQITIVPYHDDPAEERSPKSPDNEPPSYEPMYDYLRSQQRPINLQPFPPHTRQITSAPEPEEQYRDEPFVIIIDQDLSQPPPPSYEELYVEDQQQRELQTLLRQYDMDPSPAEDICKFIVAMLLIALTVACLAVAFHWRELGCNGLRCS